MSTEKIVIKDVFKETGEPQFIANMTAFKKARTIEKIFPSLGLSNTSKEVEVDNSRQIKTCAKALLGEITSHLHERHDKLDRWIKKEHLKPLSNKRLVKAEKCLMLLQSLRKSISLGRSSYDGYARIRKGVINHVNEKISLNVTNDIDVGEDKAFLKKGERLFGAYNKINELLKESKFLSMPKLEEFNSFKEFSSSNVPKLKYKIVFSSEGKDGIMDIATMSMRGIQSCQSWASGNSQCLLGSIIDPFTAIIYYTPGVKFNTYGSKMIRRCVVRYALHKSTNKPAILLERMYPSFDKAIDDAFIEFIREKTNGKIDVFSSNNYARGHEYYVPLSKNLKGVVEPYRDSGIEYRKPPSIFDNAQDIARIVFEKIEDSTARAVESAMRRLKLVNAPDQEKDFLRIIRNRDPYAFPHDINSVAYRKTHKFFAITKEKVKPHDTVENFIAFTINKYDETLNDHILGLAKSCFNSYCKPLANNEVALTQVVENATVAVRKTLQIELKKLNTSSTSLNSTENKDIVAPHLKFVE